MNPSMSCPARPAGSHRSDEEATRLAVAAARVTTAVVETRRGRTPHSAARATRTAVR